MAENAENLASDGHFRSFWRLWPKMQKIQLLMVIFVKQTNKQTNTQNEQTMHVCATSFKRASRSMLSQVSAETFF